MLEESYRRVAHKSKRYSIDLQILRTYVLPHLEQLCKEFLRSVVINNARVIKMSTLEIRDRHGSQPRGLDSGQNGITVLN